MDYTNLIRFLIWLDCFSAPKTKDYTLLPSLTEEIFFFLSPKNYNDVFHYTGIIRYIDECMPEKDQQDLLFLMQTDTEVDYE